MEIQLLYIYLYKMRKLKIDFINIILFCSISRSIFGRCSKKYTSKTCGKNNTRLSNDENIDFKKNENLKEDKNKKKMKMKMKKIKNL